MALTITIPGAVEATIGATAPAILTVGVGVPGATGATGATGAQGPQGDPGEGVPVGGSAGQVLAKIDGTNYNTTWSSLPNFLTKAGNLGGLANVTTARVNLNLGPTVAQVFAGVSGSNGAPFVGETYYSTYNSSFTGFTSNQSYYSSLPPGEGGPNLTEYKAVELTNEALSFNYNTYQLNGDLIASYGFHLDADGLYYDRSVGNSWGIGIGGVTFPDATVQTTAAVTPDLSPYAPLASPAFTGNPTAPTATFGDNDTSIATTAFVQAGLLGGTAIARNLEVEVRNQSGSTVAAGSIVYISGATGNKPLITLAQANSDTNSAQTIGFVKTSIANNGTGYVIVRGVLENIDTSALTEGVQLYLSPSTAGTWTTTKPYAPDHLVYVGIVIRSHPTQGTILVAVQNGYELDELHNVAAQTPSNLDLLSYESSTSLWKNKSFSTLGLLTSATAASTYQTQAGMSSYLTTATAASTYQTQAGMSSYLTTSTAASTYLAKASNLSDLANVSTARTNLGLTSLATASFSTNAQAVAGTSTTTAMTPASAYWADKRTGHSFVQFNAMTASTSGTGATSVASNGAWVVAAPTTASGNGIGSFNFPAAQRGINRVTGSWNWAKRFTATFRYSRNNAATDANSISRVSFGKTNAVGDPTVNCVGIRMSGANALQLLVHNGTTLTPVTTTSSIVPTVAITYDMRIVSDGAGNVSLYVNDTLEATTAAGPTGVSGTGSSFTIMTEAQNTATISTTPAAHGIYNLHVEFED